MSKKVLVYHTALSSDATPDDLDVLVEVQFVSDVLKKIGYEVEQRPFELDPLKKEFHSYNKIKKEIREINPLFIFNLVEAVEGKDSLAYLAPLLLGNLHINYTGCTAKSFLRTESKTIAKKFLNDNKIPTPYYLDLSNVEENSFLDKKFLIKSKTDHASKNLESTLIAGRDVKDALMNKNDERENFFAEEYIEGREFNISIVGSLRKGKVLPIPEMQFFDWPVDKPKIVGYSEKWDENSKDYNKLERTFEFSDSDKPLLEQLSKICKKCWDVFDLRGYARIDFRVSDENKPYVLEINANPCISPDAGFIAAAHQAGMTDEQVIKNIIKDSCKELANNKRMF